MRNRTSSKKAMTSPEKRDELIVPTLDELFTRLAPLKTQKGVLYFGITGSWRKTSGEVERGVREAVRKMFNHGDGIVSGGALNVDWFATDEAMKADPKAERIKIFLPVTLALYAAHYRRRAQEGVITPEQAEILIEQLTSLQRANPNALIENTVNTIVDTKTYYERNTEVVNASDAMVGFQVNESAGVGDTLEKAIAQNKPVCVQSYTIQ